MALHPNKLFKLPGTPLVKIGVSQTPVNEQRLLPNGLEPYSPEEIDNLNKDWLAESMKDPPGWSEDNIDLALCWGYSKSGLQNLRPTSGDCICIMTRGGIYGEI